MARTVTPLTDPKCEAAKPREKDYTLFDGQGLFLLVKPSGTKVWRFKFTRPDGREGLATFGNYPALGLKSARDKKAAALELLAEGIDPIEHERHQQEAAKAAARNTFQAIALDWHAATGKTKNWTPDHAAKVMRRMELYLFPPLGHRPVDKLKVRDLLAPLKAAEQRDTVGDVRRRAGQPGLDAVGQQQFPVQVSNAACDVGAAQIDPDTITHNLPRFFHFISIFDFFTSSICDVDLLLTNISEL